MKQTRLQQAWTVWLTLPGVMRLGAVIFVFIVAGLLWPSPARADLVARNGANELRLLPTVCDVAAVLAEVGPTLGARMRTAHARVNGQDFQACWVVYEGNVFVMYDDGDRSAIPLGAFAEQPEA